MFSMLQIIQGGSNMTGTYAACLHTNQSRSYLNHLVLGSIVCKVLWKTLCPVLVVFMTQPTMAQERYQNRVSTVIIHICK